jgi:hypothetical protein
MTDKIETPNYIQALLKPNAGKPQGRKVWSVDLETVWLPFFTATNAMGNTAIPSEALGAPLRLGYNKDGSVKFSNSGRPVIRVAKDLSDSVKLVRENFIAGLQGFTHEVYTNQAEAYKAEVMKSMEAGKPITANDNANLRDAQDKIIKQALEQADKAEAVAKKQAEAVEVAEANNEAETPSPERELIPA